MNRFVQFSLIALALNWPAWGQIQQSRTAQGARLITVAAQDRDDQAKRDQDDDDRRRDRDHRRHDRDDKHRRRDQDSYYSRWLGYRRSNNQSEAESMDRRMRDAAIGIKTAIGIGI